MSARLEVLHNGKRVCTSGLNGDGVLTATVDYVKQPNKEPQFHLHVGGLGQYHPTLRQPHNVSWPAAEIGTGDEITIRILPAGDFDLPEGMTANPSASIDDPLFGQLEYHVDAWDGLVPFDYPPFTSAHVHLVAPDSGPLESQRTLFRELGVRHHQLWPAIAEALVRCHAEISSTHELVGRIEPMMCICLDDQPTSLLITYSLSGDPSDRAYLITIRDWEIVEVCSAD